MVDTLARATIEPVEAVSMSPAVTRAAAILDLLALSAGTRPGRVRSAAASAY